MDDGSKKIKAEGEEGDKMEIRVLIDNYEASVIIGKAGANVQRVRTESGSFVSILKTESQVSKERVMTVKGTEPSIVSALIIIVRLLLEATNQRKQTDPAGAGDPETSYTLKLLIHKFLAGCLIGKAGSISKEIQEATKVQMHLSQDPLASSTEKSVTLTGTPEVLEAGLTRVINQLSQPSNQLRQGSTTILYVPGMSVAFASAPPPQFGYANPYAPQGQPPFSPYGAPPQQYAQAPAMYGGAAPAGAGAGGQTKTEKIVIPTVCAGTVIGKGGTIIRDIKTQSGTNITIADPEPTAQGDRVVSVTGTAQGIAAAIYLIRQRVESYQPPAGGAPAAY